MPARAMLRLLVFGLSLRVRGWLARISWRSSVELGIGGTVGLKITGHLGAVTHAPNPPHHIHDQKGHDAHHKKRKEEAQEAWADLIRAQSGLERRGIAGAGGGVEQHDQWQHLAIIPRQGTSLEIQLAESRQLFDKR
ncbi:hypothetical protein RSal33209_3048 [Renibacterium salmoninarum ATCC 33209]|uniref:Uncharacterized protein n=1 Tax=Renibacterium salmoninarum (strain ATCC 33209 / DSM 20767 / JCM 11484 / NBRC 15589 / NCIMB 2235) TaxID=288705 RepID=A9WU99_RENSM|nr:hypothetical protein RSal33209_3048 [Renibacterium salmoninarum ATCC 33209]